MSQKLANATTQGFALQRACCLTLNRLPLSIVVWRVRDPGSFYPTILPSLHIAPILMVLQDQNCCKSSRHSVILSSEQKTNKKPREHILGRSSSLKRFLGSCSTILLLSVLRHMAVPSSKRGWEMQSLCMGSMCQV